MGTLTTAVTPPAEVAPDTATTEIDTLGLNDQLEATAKQMLAERKSGPCRCGGGALSDRICARHRFGVLAGERALCGFSHAFVAMTNACLYHGHRWMDDDEIVARATDFADRMVAARTTGVMGG